TGNYRQAIIDNEIYARYNDSVISGARSQLPTAVPRDEVSNEDRFRDSMKQADRAQDSIVMAENKPSEFKMPEIHHPMLIGAGIGLVIVIIMAAVRKSPPSA